VTLFTVLSVVLWLVKNDIFWFWLAHVEFRVAFSDSFSAYHHPPPW
jgi:hypothetical protein